MDKWIAYSFACSLSFIGFAGGVFVAVVPFGDVTAGVTIATLGLIVFCSSIASALRERPAAPTLVPEHLYDTLPAAETPPMRKAA